MAMFRIKHQRSLRLTGLVALLAGSRNEGATFEEWILSIFGSGRWFAPHAAEAADC